MVDSGAERLGQVAVGLLVVALAGVLLRVELGARHDRAKLRATGVEAVGTVTDVEERAWASIVNGHTVMKPVHHVEVRFSDQEGRSHTKGFDREPSGLGVGDTVPLLYDQDSPTRAAIVDSCTRGGPWCDRASWLSLGFAGLLVLFGAGMIGSGTLGGTYARRR